MSETLTPLQLTETVTGLPGYTKSVGTRVVLAERGEVHLALDRRDDLLQFNGFFHGGVVSGLIDHAAGAAITTALPPGRIAVTIALTINFLSPADGRSLLARAKAIQVGSTVGVANVEVVTRTDEEERPCAFATATMRAVAMPRLSSG